MKKQLCKILILAGALLLSGCHGDLDIDQKSQITSTNMWKSESDVQAAVNGAYAQMRAAFASSYTVYGDYRSALYGGGMMSLVDYDRMAANTIFRDNDGTNWQALYTTINDCNLILKYTPDIPFNDESNRERYLADALFVRAFTYFWIARIWGDAPLLTAGFESDSQDDLFPVRAPQADVFAQVETDITEALERMPAGVNARKTASRAAINMLKADYFLWKAKVLGGGETALRTAQTAIDAVLAAADRLSESCADIFANESNPEILFSINFERNEYTGGYASMFLIPIQYVDDKSLVENPIKVGSHQQYVSVTDEYEAFLTEDPNDSRVPTSFMVYQEGLNRFRWINKFVGEWENDTRYFSSDIIVYRIAEALLMKAEVE
ncbi:MAG: RagB/SusD family nutrient uptake outer membrane protein, partial [Rikenellaceae bacterium]|nr:RagB/SusD family nutrient uptake outer membrane protein [Rikenellaceae bacterium]